MTASTDFLARAKAHHIFVILTDDGVPLLGGYADLINPYCCSTFANYNADYLSPGGLEAEKRYANDLVQGLIDQRALLDAILAFELRNELYFVSDQPPLSLSSGLVTTANGRTYDMTDPAAKQRMMDDNLIYWTDQAHGVIMGLDPSAPVTVGFFASEGPNPVIQPYPAMANSTADFVDLHTYPRIDFSLAQYVEHFGFGGYLAKPVIMGEFGAFKSVYGNSQDAAVGLRAWQVDSCQYMFKGWLLWTWDTDEQPELWNGLSETGLINAALAPAARPDPCVN